jgi:hypothetical protein
MSGSVSGQSRVERNIPSYPFTLCPGVGFEWRLPSESCIFFVHAIALQQFHDGSSAPSWHFC